MSAKACVGCSRLIAPSFTTCTFCGAAQPEVAAPEAREQRCPTCKRPFSARLGACPFCVAAPVANAPAAAPGFSAVAPRLGTPGAAPAIVSSDADEARWVSSALLFGLPIVVMAIWGIGQTVSARRLGEEGGGLVGPGFTVALFVAPALAVGFVRRAVGRLSDIMEGEGLPRLVLSIGAVAAIALIPLALAFSGSIAWFNGIGIEDRAQDVTCTASSVMHRTRKRTDMGWEIAYACVVEGERYTGSIDHLMDRPSINEGDTFRMRAGRGRAGTWLRVGDALVSARAPE